MLWLYIISVFSRQIDVQISYIDAPLINIHWCSDTVLALTSKGSVYRSDDRGRQWVKMSEIFHRKALVELEDSDERVGIVNNLVPSPLDKKLVIFTGTDSIAWISVDCGKTISVINSGKQLREFSFHPTEKDWILATSWKRCGSDELLQTNNPCVSVKEVLLSEDSGITWHTLATYINQFSWGAKTEKQFKYTPKKRIYVSYDPQGKGHQSLSSWNIDQNLYYSDDFFQTRQLVVKSGSKFLLSEKYLFVAQVTSTYTQEVSLLVADTQWINEFSVVDADSKLLEHSYHILDTSQNQVFMVVNHLKPSSLIGVIYISDSTGTRYMRSLENAVRLEQGAEFYRVQGLEGIYLANIYAEEQSKIYEQQILDSKTQGFGGGGSGFKDEDLKKYKQTKITFDKGATWVNLKAPTIDSEGRPINCTRCYLHLHLGQSFYQYAPIYSQANSIGLIIATGSIGKYLSYKQNQVNTYLSRDGGLTWSEIRKGSYIYEISNHGGLIIMSQDQESTNQFVYTWNEGLDWNIYTFVDEKIDVQNIITEPHNKATRFISYGSTTVESNGIQSEQGILATIDLDDLHQRDCIGQDIAGEKNSDYELWTPSGIVQPDCLFGKKVTYIRRKREAACYNPDELERIVSEVPCPCTQEDYECDVGFQYENQQCVPINPDNLGVPAQCHDYYIIKSGYTKLAGNICQGGLEYVGIKVSCPGNNGILNWIIFAAFLGLFYWCYQNQAKLLELYQGKSQNELPTKSKEEKLLEQIKQKQNQFKPIDLEDNENKQQYQEFDEDLLDVDKEEPKDADELI